MLKDILSYGIGTLAAFLVIGTLVLLFVRDITQKKHSVLRNYPVYPYPEPKARTRVA
jgi:hypothetical protein